jgi:hypothetical protein
MQRRSADGLSGLHLLVLGVAYAGRARTAEDVASELGLDVGEILRVCTELEAAGFLAWAPPH